MWILSSQFLFFHNLIIMLLKLLKSGENLVTKAWLLSGGFNKPRI